MASVLGLQRSAGNAATAALLGGTPGVAAHSARAVESPALVATRVAIRRAGGHTPVVQKRENEFASFLNLGVDPRTGMRPAQQYALDEFVRATEAALESWDTQRGTPNMRFGQDVNIREAYSAFRKAIADDPYHELVWQEAIRQLRVGKNKAYVREIRVFNPTMLGDLKRMLEVEDAPPSHTYELQPIWGSGGGGAGYGVQIGVVAKHVKIRYTNSEIPGLGWTQVVSLAGFKLGFGWSYKPGASLEGSGPDDWNAASDQPQAQYLEPDFFRGATFTSPQVSGSVSLGAAKVKKNFGETLLLSKGMYRLNWTKPCNSQIYDDIEAELPLGEDMHEDLALGGNLEAVNEFGSTDLVGDVDFTAGEWSDLKGEEQKASDAWVPLHYARIFFETGSAALTPKPRTGKSDFETGDFRTIDQIVDAIVRWDKKEGYRGSLFKVSVSGSHSQKWDEFDDELQVLEAKEATDGELRRKDMERLGDLRALKELENYSLALRRAHNVEEVMKLKLAFKHQQMTYGVMAKSGIEKPTTHDPIGENAFGNLDEDRSVTILVSYQIFNPASQVNLNATAPM